MGTGTGRGAREKSQENAIRAAEQAARGGRIDALSITDNPAGDRPCQRLAWGWRL
jgi:hypothetical protein